MRIALVAILVAIAVGLVGQQQAAESSSPGTTVSPLLSCPNVDGSVDNKVLIADILSVVQAYFQDYPDEDYTYLYDVVGPYNPETGLGGIQRVDDILHVLGRYFDVCPVVDTEVARATIWGIDNLPVFEDASALRDLGYLKGSFDVPGQGVHYVNLDNWDGIFDPAAPEGIVYQDGRLAAQLYVTDGNIVGWGDHAATGWPPPAVPHEVALEGDSDGPQCSPKCSWDGDFDGWHLHYYLCTTDIGTPNASAIPGFQTAAQCQGFGGGDPECTIPVTVTPCYRWASTVGWMGHLWNWLPNANRIPDVNGMQNGRFADCFPDGGSWKDFNCPA
jgi:hypothetical protein